MKFEETPKGFRLSFGKNMTDLQKLKMHFFLGFLSGVQIMLGINETVLAVKDGKSWWLNGLFLALSLFIAYSFWRMARNEWNRVAARFEPESLEKKTEVEVNG